MRHKRIIYKLLNTHIAPDLHEMVLPPPASNGLPRIQRWDIDSDLKGTASTVAASPHWPDELSLCTVCICPDFPEDTVL